MEVIGALLAAFFLRLTGAELVVQVKKGEFTFRLKFGREPDSKP